MQLYMANNGYLKAVEQVKLFFEKIKYVLYVDKCECLEIFSGALTGLSL